MSHNPYFNRWFSAIKKIGYVTLSYNSSHNPYFNRWFSAIEYGLYEPVNQYVTILILIDGFLQYKDVMVILFGDEGHNPYFNRWFSAIWN